VAKNDDENIEKYKQVSIRIILEVEKQEDKTKLELYEAKIKNSIIKRLNGIDIKKIKDPDAAEMIKKRIEPIIEEYTTPINILVQGIVVR
jgi:flagellar basal body-associated protein FliL